MTRKRLSLFSLWDVRFITTRPTRGMFLNSKFAASEARGREVLSAMYLQCNKPASEQLLWALWQPFTRPWHLCLLIWKTSQLHPAATSHEIQKEKTRSQH